MAGANFDFLPDATLRPGALIGVTFGKGGGLFAGPSFSFSVFQLALGAQLLGTSSEEGAGDGVDGAAGAGAEESALGVRFAGALSFDLSRLSGQKKIVNQLTVKNPTAGGGWGKTTDEVAAGLGLALFSVESPRDDVIITAAQVRNLAGEVPTPTSKLLFAQPYPIVDKLWFVPLGHYQASLSTEECTFLGLEFGAPAVFSVSSAFNVEPVEWVLECKEAAGPPSDGP